MWVFCCALIAFTLLTGARDSAIASMKLKRIDLQTGCFFQDAGLMGKLTYKLTSWLRKQAD